MVLISLAIMICDVLCRIDFKACTNKTLQAMSAAQVQVEAQMLEAALGDGCNSMVNTLSGLGSCGKHPQNVERDLYRKLALPTVRHQTCKPVIELLKDIQTIIA